MTVPTPVEPDSEARLGSRCLAVVGTGGLADELANQLEALGVGRIDLYGRSVKLEPANPGGYRVVAGPDTCTLSLADVGRYDTIFATDEDPGAVELLNELCLLAGVRLVVIGTRGTAIAVGIYPFGDGENPACHACCAVAVAESNGARAASGHAPTQRIAAGFAVTLGLPEATAPGTPATRRLVGSSTQGRVHTVDVLRRRDCAVCSRVVGPVRIVRTGNRWATHAGVLVVGAETLQQVVQLSDAIVTAATCNACGVLTAQQAGKYLNRRAPDSTATDVPCPVCGMIDSMHFESHREFTLADLAQRFGSGPAPARYALMRMTGATICFDLSDSVERRPGHRPVVMGGFGAGFVSIEAGRADVARRLMLRSDEG